MSKSDVTATKALKRLMDSLLNDVADGLSRAEVLEEALSYAAIVTKQDLPNPDELRDQLDSVAVQMLVDKVEREDLKVYQVGVTCDHDEHIATIVATMDDTIAAEVDAVVVRHAEKAKKAAEEADYSIN